MDQSIWQIPIYHGSNPLTNPNPLTSIDGFNSLAEPIQYFEGSNILTDLGSHSQHFIFFVTYKWVQPKARMLHYIRLESHVNDKHSSLLGPIISIEESVVNISFDRFNPLRNPLHYLILYKETYPKLGLILSFIPMLAKIGLLARCLSLSL